MRKKKFLNKEKNKDVWVGYVSHVSEFTKIKIKIMIRHNKLSQNYRNS